MKLTGDWNKADKIIFQADFKNFKRVVIKALEKVLIFYKKAIRKNIRTGGAYAGKPFIENSEVTIRIKGSSAPLIDTFDMHNSVDYIINNLLGFVGLERGKMHDASGKPLEDIAKINEMGAILEGGIVIPARPFIRPVLQNVRIFNEAKQIFMKYIRQVYRA